MKKYFCGWYYRCQSDKQTLAIIPSIHKTSDSAFCNIQIITDSDAFQISCPESDFNKNHSEICIGNHTSTANPPLKYTGPTMVPLFCL